MSNTTKRYNYKEQAQKAYAYWCQYGTWGCLERGWRWLVRQPERLTAIATLAIFIATAVAAGVGIAQWRALHSTDLAIRDQLRLMEADQRPWIGPPKIDVKVNDSSAVTFTFTLGNIGRTPTYGIDIRREIIPQDSPGSWEPKVREWCKTVKEEATRSLVRFRTFTSFPGADFLAASYPDEGKTITIDQLRAIVSPHFVGCVVYGRRGSVNLHQTGFVSRIEISTENSVSLRTFAIDVD